MTLFLCNETGKSYYETWAAQFATSKLCTDDRAWHSFQQSHERIDNCVIQVELDWNGHQALEHFGFQLARAVRAKYRCPIYLCSFFPKEDFELRLSQYALLRVPTHHQLIQLPQLAYPELSSTALSYYQWEDICETLLAKDSLIREILHELKNKLLFTQEEALDKVRQSAQKQLRFSMQSIQALLDTTQHPQLARIQQNLWEQMQGYIEKQAFGQLPVLVEDLSNTLVALAPNSNETANSDEFALTLTPWKVLVVEDDIEVQRKLKIGFERNRIQYEMLQEGQLALQYIDEDKRNTFTVLLCDIRLKKANSEFWQDLQGYDILEQVYLHKRERFLAFFAITSARKRLLRLKRNYQVQLHAYYKGDIQFSEAAMNLFCDKIREQGEHVYFKLKSRPKLSSWTKGNPKRFHSPLQHYYREHLFAPDYLHTEEKINQLTRQYVSHVQQGQPTDDIDFTGTLKSHPPDSQEGLEKFRFRTLLGRRIALHLYIEAFGDKEIFYSMQPHARVKDVETSMKLLFATSLALSFKKDFPKLKSIQKGNFLKSNLLEEEVIYLQKILPEKKGLLEQVRLDKKDMDILFGLLDDLNYNLRGKTATGDEIQDKLATFRKEDFEKIQSIKKAKECVTRATELAQYFKLDNSFKENIAFDIDVVNNKELRAFMQTLIKS